MNSKSKLVEQMLWSCFEKKLETIPMTTHNLKSPPSMNSFSVAKLKHIFQKAQVNSNKMVHKKIYHFLAQVFMVFHVVWSVLFRVLAPETTFWTVEFLQQPIRRIHLVVFEANTRNKTNHTMWKGMQNCAKKWFLFLCTILFEVTWAFWKMWTVVQWTTRITDNSPTSQLCGHQLRTSAKLWQYLSLYKPH